MLCFVGFCLSNYKEKSDFLRGKEQIWGRKVESRGNLDMLNMSHLPDPHREAE